MSVSWVVRHVAAPALPPVVDVAAEVDVVVDPGCVETVGLDDADEPAVVAAGEFDADVSLFELFDEHAASDETAITPRTAARAGPLTVAHSLPAVQCRRPDK